MSREKNFSLAADEWRATTLRLLCLIGMIYLPAGCAHIEPSSHDPLRQFTEEPSQELKDALESYRQRRVGVVARLVRLDGLTPHEIDLQMSKQSECARYDEVARSEASGEPVVCQGRSIPMVIWSCKDGSMIRYKPLGDACSLFRPQPHGSKAVRWPVDAPASRFQSEAFKVTSDGRAVPKHPRELRKGLSADKWGDEAHFDLR